jgi:hypothetical protein
LMVESSSISLLKVACTPLRTCFWPISHLPSSGSSWGDWNAGIVARITFDGQPHFERVSRILGSGITGTKRMLVTWTLSWEGSFERAFMN